MLVTMFNSVQILFYVIFYIKNRYVSKYNKERILLMHVLHCGQNVDKCLSAVHLLHYLSILLWYPNNIIESLYKDKKLNQYSQQKIAQVYKEPMLTIFKHTEYLNWVLEFFYLIKNTKIWIVVFARLMFLNDLKAKKYKPI